MVSFQQQLSQENGECVPVIEQSVFVSSEAAVNVDKDSSSVKISVVVVSFLTFSVGVAFLAKRYLLR